VGAERGEREGLVRRSGGYTSENARRRTEGEGEGEGEEEWGAL
jgi:hypothetical protein